MNICLQDTLEPCSELNPIEYRQIVPFIELKFSKDPEMIKQSVERHVSAAVNDAADRVLSKHHEGLIIPIVTKGWTDDYQLAQTEFKYRITFYYLRLRGMHHE